MAIPPTSSTAYFNWHKDRVRETILTQYYILNDEPSGQMFQRRIMGELILHINGVMGHVFKNLFHSLPIAPSFQKHPRVKVKKKRKHSGRSRF